jgi:urea transport system permease protein
VRRFARAFALFLLLLSGGLAYAGDDQFAGLARDNYSDIEKSVQALATSTDPNAYDIVEALSEGRLFVAGAQKLVLQDKKGGWRDQAGATLTEKPEGARAVRANNRVRRAVDAALGALSLRASDPNKRLDAARAVFRARDAAALPAVNAALAAEKAGSTISNALLQARAAILVSQPGASTLEQIDAIATLRERGDRDALSLLKGMNAAPNSDVKGAADAAIRAIERRLDLWSVAQNAWYGLSLGSVLLLAAIGLAITFGVMGVINMAHGEMVMIGAYTTFAVQEWIRVSKPALFDYSLLIALPLAFLTAGLVGILIERIVIRFLYGRPLETLLATFGVSLILQQTVRSLFGANNREVGAPGFMSGAFELGGLSITYGRMWIIAFALAVFLFLQFILRATSFGLHMRAVTQNRRMAASVGISTTKIDALAFGLGSGIAGIAGVALSQIDNVSPNLGQGYIIDSFMVVVFGGVGNLWGTLVAALTLGVANKFLEPFAGAVLAKIAMLVFIILFIQKRPRGLFALKGRAVES